MSTHGGGGRQRAAAFIREQDISAWTAGNPPGVPAVGYHYGSDEHIARLGREGIDVARNRTGLYGAGFYLFNGPQPAAQHRYGLGEAYVRVAIRMHRPYTVDMGTTQGRAEYEAKRREANAQADRQEYDRLVSLADQYARRSLEADQQRNYEEARQLSARAMMARNDAFQVQNRAFSDMLQRDGYDGIVLHNVQHASLAGPYRDEVVAILPSTVRVIKG